MQVSAINMQNSKPSFGAKIVVKTEEMKNVMEYLKEYSTETREGYYNSAKDLKLMDKIFDAFEKHPSKEEIVPDAGYFKGCLFGARGILKSSRAAFIDTEPARDDSTAPIQNIFRRILNPENKKQFNKLVGEEHSSIYDIWWNEHVAPIWEDVNQRFREKTFFEGNHDKKFDADFNRESGREKDFFNQRGNYWIKLWNKHIAGGEIYVTD